MVVLLQFGGRTIVLLALFSAYCFLLAAILFYAFVRSLGDGKAPRN